MALRARKRRDAREREMEPEVAQALVDAGVYRLLVPRAQGGAEATPADYVAPLGPVEVSAGVAAPSSPHAAASTRTIDDAHAGDRRVIAAC